MRKEHYYRRGGSLDAGVVARYWRFVGEARTVLDVGCGRGDFGRLKPAGRVVYGVDADEGAVEQASAHEIATRVNLDVEPLPFPDASFDAAFAKDVIEHLQDPLRFLLELRRVLRPGAVVVISVPMEYPWVVWNDYTHIRGFTKDALTAVLEDARYEVAGVVPIGGIPLFGRFGWVDAIPKVLSLPGMRRLLGRSWEAVARKP